MTPHTVVLVVSLLLGLSIVIGCIGDRRRRKHLNQNYDYDYYDKRYYYKVSEKDF